MRNGIELTEGMLHHYEDMMLSEEEIAKKLGISRAGLHKIRIKMGCRVRFRSDRGTRRVSDEEKRIRWNVYMKGYRTRNFDKNRRASIRIGSVVMRRSRHNATFVIGRILGDTEVVHHVDGDPMNDAYGNLLVFANQGDHLAWHRGEDVRPVEAEIV